MLLHRKLFLHGVVLSVLLCSSLVVSVDATSMWNRTYGGTATEKAYSLVATSDGGYAIAGIWNYSYYSGWWYFLENDSSSFYSYVVGGDFWLVKINEFGDMQWNKTYGGQGYDMAYSLVETSDGGYAMAGTTNGELGAFWGDVWLIKTDSAGNMQWNQTYGEGFAYSLVATSDGGFAIAGVTNGDFWLVKTDAFGNMEWNRTYGGTGYDWAKSLVATSDGGYAIAGATDYFGSTDFWLFKTDSLGNMEWNHTYGGTGDEGANSLIAAPDGGYVIAGYTSMIFGRDYWLVKTDDFGNMQWNKTGTGYGEAYSVIAASDGGYAIAGNMYASSYIWLVKTDELGNKEWWERYGGIENNEACSVIAAPDGGYAIASATNGDCWLLKTDENGVVPEYSSFLVPALVLTATAFIIINKKRLIRTR
jgi:hypothetical protein